MKKEYLNPPMTEVVELTSDNLVLMVSGNAPDMTVEDKDVTWN